MLGKAFSRFIKRKDKAQAPNPSPGPESDSPLGDISSMLSASGRIGLANLRKIAQENEKDTFMRFVRQPVLAGAAIQAGVLSGEVSDIVLVDVAPLTLGVETLGGVATSLIARNTPIPIKHTETFTTAADMQTAVTVYVYQGERPMARDNTSLGEFNLEGLPPAPRGIPKIDVTFDIDANGILNVTAQDQATSKTQSISITGSTRLSDEEKQRMIDEAERYEEDDTKRREKAEKLNAADSMCYQAEKLLAEFPDKITDEMRNRLQTAMRKTREALQQQDAGLAAERSKELSG